MPVAKKLPQGDLEQCLWLVIARRAEQLNIAQGDLSRAVGISQSQVSRIMSGARPGSLSEGIGAAEAVGLTFLGAVREAEQLLKSRSMAAGARVVIGKESTATRSERAFDTTD